MELTRRKFLTVSAMSAALMATPKILMENEAVLAALDDPFLKMDAVAQAKAIKKGDASAVEVLEAAIKRIDALNPKTNAVVTKAYDHAMKNAKAGKFKGPFAGVPFLVKDLNDVAGIRTTSGCRALINQIAKRDHPYIKACIDVGFNICGKTNTPEFGLQATTESLALGPCMNPWDSTKSSGGSSGGTGAAVAAGMVPIAHGNDGGGSIRIPASCCGIFGLKPDIGRLIGSGNGFGIAVQGGLSRSVRDSAQLIASTERDKPAPGLKPVGFVKGPKKKRLKIGVTLKGTVDREPDADVAQAIHSTAMLCKELGHEVSEMSLDYDHRRSVDDFLTLWSSTAGEIADSFEKELGRKVTPQDLEPLTLTFSEIAHKNTREDMGKAVGFLRSLKETITNEMNGYDVILSPVLSSAPPMIGEQGPTVPYETLIDRMMSYVAYTPLANITGMPAMSVPLYWNDNNMPIGSHFTAHNGDERTLLELAYELEEARPWANKWAPNSAGV